MGIIASNIYSSKTQQTQFNTNGSGILISSKKPLKHLLLLVVDNPQSPHFQSFKPGYINLYFNILGFAFLLS